MGNEFFLRIFQETGDRRALISRDCYILNIIGKEWKRMRERETER